MAISPAFFLLQLPGQMQHLLRFAGYRKNDGCDGGVGRDGDGIERVGHAQREFAQIGQIPCTILGYAAGIADAHQKHPLCPCDHTGGFVQRCIVFRRADFPQKVLQLAQRVRQTGSLRGTGLLLQLPFELRITVTAHLFAEVQHCGGGNVRFRCQLPDAHEGHRVRMLDDVLVDQQFQLVQIFDLLRGE